MIDITVEEATCWLLIILFAVFAIHDRVKFRKENDEQNPTDQPPPE